MEAMLNTLLGFFRLESGKEEVNPVPFRLHTVIETLEADFMPLAADKNLFLNMESSKDRVVIGDKKRIVQIGHNLLSNAIKFTERGAVTLRMRFDNGTLQLSVEDTGTGMSAEEQARVSPLSNACPTRWPRRAWDWGSPLSRSWSDCWEAR